MANLSEKELIEVINTLKENCKIIWSEDKLCQKCKLIVDQKNQDMKFKYKNPILMDYNLIGWESHMIELLKSKNPEQYLREHI